MIPPQVKTIRKFILRDPMILAKFANSNFLELFFLFSFCGCNYCIPADG